MRKSLIAGAGLVAALAFTGCAGSDGGESTGGGTTDGAAEDYPTEDITFIVPYPAGSGPDGWGRVVAQELENELGTSVIVENREGGASTIGLFELAGREPDGYSIGLASFSGLSLQSRLIDNPFEGIETLTPIAQTKTPAFLLFSSPDNGYESIDAFIEDAKSRPGEITVGVPNANSVPDILIQLLEESADIELEQVYFDAGQQVLPTVNGTVDVGIAQAGPVVQFVEAGDLSFVGTFGSEQAPGLDVPLFDDEGYDTSRISDYEGVFGPAGLPEDIVGRISEAIGVAVESDAFQELMETSYASAAFIGQEDFGEHALELDATADELIDELGLGQ